MGFASRFRPTYAWANEGHPSCSRRPPNDNQQSCASSTVVSHISLKTSEIWGTRSYVVDTGSQSFGGYLRAAAWCFGAAQSS